MTRLPFAALLLGGAMLPCLACADPDGGNGCRSDDDCAAAAACASANDEGPRCGIGPPADDCAADAECASPTVCAVVERNSCTEHRACAQPCDAGSCSADERCGADGRCVPAPCDDGFTCAAWRTCGGEGGAVDAHGCVTPSCASDFDCADGAVCVNRLCAPRAGTCELPVP